MTVYKDVVIGGGSGYAIKTGVNDYQDSYVSLQGCTVNGTVVLEAPKVEKPNKTNMEMLDVTVNGTVQLPAQHALTLSGKVYIKKLVPAEDARVILKSLEKGSSISVDADGIFTTASSGIAAQTGRIGKYCGVFNSKADS